MHPKAIVQPFIGTKIKVTAVINFWVKFVQSVQFWHEFRGSYSIVFKELFLLGFPYSLGRILGMNFETFRIALIVGTTVQCMDFWFRNRGAKLQECPDKFV
jgi:hypothetical protein